MSTVFNARHLENIKLKPYCSRCSEWHFWHLEFSVPDSRIRPANIHLPLLLEPRDCKECVPPKSPRRPPFGGQGMLGISVLGLFSHRRQASAFLLVNWSWPHKRSPFPSPAPCTARSPTSAINYCQSTPNTLSTADLNHVEELLVPIEPRMCLYNSKNWAISMAVALNV